jgi:hypothetical protein
MLGLTRRNRRRGQGVHANTFRPICLEQVGTESVPVETMNEGKTPGWRLGTL